MTIRDPNLKFSEFLYHAQQLAKNLSTMYGNQLFNDVIFLTTADKRVFLAYKSIFSAKSKVGKKNLLKIAQLE